MSSATPLENRQLLSRVDEDGVLTLSLQTAPVPEPGPGEVVVRVEAAPINPSDLGLLLAGADTATAEYAGTGDAAIVKGRVPSTALRSLSARYGQALPVGNEGAGVVVAAGSDPEAQALIGRTVAMFAGAMFARYRVFDASECLVLPDAISAEEGASAFVNPLTSLAFVETMRREGHSALVHTAAASNLGQMLVKVCREDGVPLVNVVRSAEQAALLRDLGAVHICDSTSPSFRGDLIEALSATGATLAFDAIGGGTMPGDILSCMEAAARPTTGAFSRYGSKTHKQVYLYGGLNPGPTTLERDYGMAWGIGGWIMTSYVPTLEPEVSAAMRARVANGLKTTFASRYTRTISLGEALQPDVLKAYAKRATGEKYLIAPGRS